MANSFLFAMPTTQKTLSNYLFGEVSDQERLSLQHKSCQPIVTPIFEQMLDQYGLGQKLATAKTANKKAVIFDVGCSEGMYLHDLAALIEHRGYVVGADLNGMDINPAVLETAEEFKLVSKPPRPYFNFYLHDLMQPLENNTGLAWQGKTHDFALIYATFVMEHLSEPRKHVLELYERLEPGGFMYLLDYIYKEGEDGWIAPHPIMSPLFAISTNIVLKNSGGVQTAVEQGNWLREAGATVLEHKSYQLEASSKNEITLATLRNYLHIAMNVANGLVAKGLYTPAQADNVRSTLFRELSLNNVGQLTVWSTLVQKPETSSI